MIVIIIYSDNYSNHSFLKVMIVGMTVGMFRGRPRQGPSRQQMQTNMMKYLYGM